MKADPKIKQVLEAAYDGFHSHASRDRDPISLVHRYSTPRDRELAAFLSALLAYGNVTTILSSVERVLKVLGPSPYQGILNGEFEGRFRGFRHRFTTGEDMEIVCRWLRDAVQNHESLENFFLFEARGETSMRILLSRFVNRLTELPLPGGWAKIRRTRARNLKYLISDPMRGSACKRLNMFLRWMVRPDDGIDFGLWTQLSSTQLMLPVDTHLLKTLRALRWTRSKQATWKVVEAATDRLRLYAPEDPIRYDFALCHLSMTGKSISTYLSGDGF